ncbi:SCO7613 C-terminal domain-containing membrane protein [Clavibacter nebraskensis]|uniref:SCO7613 C-terminal domain-containing membrane protein n=1 Tax=Clavibacter nebraskensis TaxID=31963 RepID=UPI003F862233
MVEDDARGSRLGAQPWAARPDALLRTDLCPDCLAELDALVCGRCGLDVRAPAAADVLDASRRVVESIAERERLLASMRRWSAAAREREAAEARRADVGPAAAAASPGRKAVPSPVAAPDAPVPDVPAAAVGTDASRPQQATTDVSPSVPVPAAAPAAPRRRVSVPAVLLAVGVVLLSVAAVFYVVYAFVTYGLVVRAAITASVTLAALAASGVLARRRLPGTAEAVGVVGIVLLHLDVWAVRSYDLAGAASTDPFVHFGVGTLIVSAALLALRPLLRIRAAGLAGWAGLAVGAGLLVGAIPSADAGTRTALALAAASAVALVHAAPRSRASAAPDALERAILRVVGVVTATAAVVAGAVSALDPAAVPALPLLVASVVSGAHAWALARAASPDEVRHGPEEGAIALDASDLDPAITPVAVGAMGPDAGEAPPRSPAMAPPPAPSEPLRILAAVVAGAGAAAAFPVTALMGGPVLLTISAQLVAAALVAAVLDVVSRRLVDARLAATARAAAVASLVVAGLAGVPAAFAGLRGITAALLVGVPAWRHGPLDDAVAVLGRTTRVVDLPEQGRAAALGIVAVWVVAVVAAWAGRRLGARGGLLAWSGAVVVIASIPALGPVAVVSGAYVAVSAAALSWRLSSRQPVAGSGADADPGPTPIRPTIPAPPLIALSLAAGSLGWAASWASTGTWWAVTPVVVLLLVAGSRSARTDGSARLAAVGGALVGLVAAGALAPSLARSRIIGAPPLTSALDAAADPVVLLLLGSGLITLVTGIVPGRPGVRRRALLATVLLPACITSLPVAIVGADRAGGALAGSPAWSIAGQAILAAGLVAWTVGGIGRVGLPARAPRADEPSSAPRPAGTTAVRRWRLTTAVLVAPVLLLAALTLAGLVDRGATPRGTVPAAVALVVAAAALLAYRRASRALRVALDAGAAAVASGALLATVSSTSAREAGDLLWIPLLLLATTTLALSVAHDGLLLSRTARRAWGWTALGLGIAALWSRLLAGGVTSAEAYWLPVAGAVLVLAALMHRAALRADGEGDDSPAGPRVRRGVTSLTLAGILTAVLPLAAVGRPEDVLRPSVLMALCAALALAAATALRRAPSPVRPLLHAVVTGGGLGLLAVGGTRTLRLAAERGGPLTAVDLQVAITAASLVAIGVLVLRAARGPAEARLAGAAWVATAALVTVAMLATVAPGDGVVRPLIGSATLVIGAGVLLVLRSVHRRVLAASAAVALLGAVVVALLAWRGGDAADGAATAIVPAIIGVLVAAVGAADRFRHPARGRVHPTGHVDAEGVLRRSADAATGLLVVSTVALGTASDASGLPVALLLSGTAVLIASTGPVSGLRRHVGWVALVLGSSALWVALGRGGVDAVEPYVLPPAGVMLLVAALLERGLAGRRRHDATIGRDRPTGAAPVLLGALLLAALPTAVASWTGTPVRALLLGAAAGVVLVLAAVALRRSSPAPGTRALLISTAAASAVTVPLVGFGRSVAQLDALRPASFGRTDLGTLAAAAVLVLAVALLPGRAAHDARDPRDALLHAAPRVAVLVALGGAAVVTTAGIVRAHAEAMDGVGPRAALLVGLVAALHVVCSPAAPAPTGPGDRGAVQAAVPPLHDRVLAVSALAVGALVAAVLVITGAADPVETVTVPIAAALVVVGARRMVHDASAGSMRHLAPGLLVLLVPPLLADLGPSPAWRIVALGILALATLLAGARLKLRAPFLIGAGVLLVHAVAQLWPWIREASATVPWWAWAGVGGVVLIAVAARYERRIRDVKEVAARVSALR